jgi:hypothetical protein
MCLCVGLYFKKEEFVEQANDVQNIITEVCHATEHIPEINYN